MSNNYLTYQSGLGSVGSYQMSGIPFVTSSTAPESSDPSGPLKISFPTVTKFLVVKNVDSAGSDLKIGFSQNGISGDNYFLLSAGESFSADLRVVDMYVVSVDSSAVEFSLIAGLTGIGRENLSSNWSGSLGVG